MTDNNCYEFPQHNRLRTPLCLHITTPFYHTLCSDVIYALHRTYLSWFHIDYREMEWYTTSTVRLLVSSAADLCIQQLRLVLLLPSSGSSRQVVTTNLPTNE
jgi:hypothetical protein